MDTWVPSFFSGATLGLLVALLLSWSKTAPRIERVERKVDLILKHLNLDYEADVVARVKELLRDPDKKVEAVTLYRRESGASLAEAKQRIEEWAREAG